MLRLSPEAPRSCKGTLLMIPIDSLRSFRIGIKSISVESVPITSTVTPLPVPTSLPRESCSASDFMNARISSSVSFTPSRPLSRLHFSIGIAKRSTRMLRSSWTFRKSSRVCMSGLRIEFPKISPVDGSYGKQISSFVVNVIIVPDSLNSHAVSSPSVITGVIYLGWTVLHFCWYSGFVFDE